MSAPDWLDSAPAVTRTWVRENLDGAFPVGARVDHEDCPSPSSCLARALLTSRHMVEYEVIAAHVGAWLRDRGLHE